MPSATDSTPTSRILVACLCARWCRTCDDYRVTLLAVRDALRLAHPQADLRFTWVDIEDEADVVGDLDIEDFPTVMIARGAGVLFFGPLLPHPQTLERLVRSALEDGLPAPSAPWPHDVQAVARHLEQRPGL